MASVAPVIEAIWERLGLPKPTERIDSEFFFEADGADVTVRAAPNGRDAILSLWLGQLGPSGIEGRDQAVSLLRQSLALAAMNEATLSLGNGAPLEAFAALNRTSGGATTAPPIDVYAQAMVPIATRDRGVAVNALADLLQWRSLAGNILAQERGAARTAPTAAVSNEADSEMMIFRP